MFLSHLYIFVIVNRPVGLFFTTSQTYFKNPSKTDININNTDCFFLGNRSWRWFGGKSKTDFSGFGASEYTGGSQQPSRQCERGKFTVEIRKSGEKSWPRRHYYVIICILKVLGQYIENLMSASQVFQTTEEPRYKWKVQCL